jgi:hypothetical protein
MGRKALAAILLPLPFAALPVAVVLLGAVFGPGESDELVIREAPSAVIQEEVVSSAPPEIEGATLASVSSPLQFEPGCADYDLIAES